MTANNLESTTQVEISSQSSELEETSIVRQPNLVKQETEALIDAIKKRAQIEAESASTLTRETYLDAVRKAREAIEGEALIERDRLEKAWKVILEEADRNWYLLNREISDLRIRFEDAFKAAWDAFTAPRR